MAVSVGGPQIGTQPVGSGTDENVESKPEPKESAPAAKESDTAPEPKESEIVPEPKESGPVDTVPEPVESAPEPKESAPDAKEAKGTDGDDVEEVEWAEDPNEDETVNGIPDYSNGFEGVDLGEPAPAPAQQQNEPDPKAPEQTDPQGPGAKTASEPEPQPEPEPGPQPEPKVAQTQRPTPSPEQPAAALPAGKGSVGGEEEEEEADDHVVPSIATEITISHLFAGQGLYVEDTDDLLRPYARSEAKPFHIVAEYEYDDRHSFYSQIFGRPQSLEMHCIFGRDGTANDFSEYSVENTRCDNKEPAPVEQELFESAVSSSSSVSVRYNMASSVLMMGSVVVVAVGVTVFSRCSTAKRR